MSTREITVGYERKFSDGNYGSEGMSFHTTFTFTLGDDRLLDEFEMTVRHLRTAVLEQLAESKAWSVAAAAKRELDPPQRTAPVSPPEAGAHVYATPDGDLEEIPF